MNTGTPLPFPHPRPADIGNHKVTLRNTPSPSSPSTLYPPPPATMPPVAPGNGANTA